MDISSRPAPFPWREELRNAALLSSVPVLLFLVFLAVSPRFTLVRDDGKMGYQPLASDTLRQTLSGELPLWSHHTGCGHPLLARNAENLYPANFLAHAVCRLLGLQDQEVLVCYLLHAYAATLLAFLYLRYLGVTFLPAATAAFAFCLAGPNLGFWTNWPPYFYLVAYLPLALLIIERLLAGPEDGTWTAVIGLMVGLVLLINSPQLTIKLFLLTGLYFLLRTDRRSFWRVSRSLLIGTALGGLVGAGQVFATA